MKRKDKSYKREKNRQRVLSDRRHKEEYDRQRRWDKSVQSERDANANRD